MRLIPEKGIITWAWVHVDITCVASTNLEELERLKESLKKKFEINADELGEHLGVNIDALEDGSMLLRQRKLLGALFDEYQPKGKKMNQSQRIRKTNEASSVNEQEQSKPCNQREYLYLLGMLIHLTHSRPEISTIISYSRTNYSSPTKEDFED